MKKIVLAALLMSSIFNAHAYGWTGNLNVFLGQKALDEEDFEPLDEQTQFGLLLDFKKENWPVSFAIDYLSSSDDITENDPFTGLGMAIEVSTTELDVGLRKIFDGSESRLKPYIGGGIALIDVEIEASVMGFLSGTVEDDATGYWLNGGVYWTLGEGFNIGVDLRYSSADVEGELDIGGTHLGLILGIHW
jgi:opacity protein-like surface antigen